MSDIDNSAFVRSLEQATLKIISNTTRKMDQACLIIERKAKQNCPVDQGILRASITHQASFDSQKIVGVIGSNLEYAPYVHQGTGIYAKNGDGRKTPWVYVVPSGKYKGGHVTQGQHPNPFLEKARDESKTQVIKALGD